MESTQEKIHEQESKVVTSALFDAADADAVFRSGDGTLFRVHAKQLEFASDGFPPADFSREGEVIDLAEDAKTLELMFQFVYPRLLPSLESLEFTTLAALAEAVEKYQVFTGMKLCNSYMAHTLTPDNAIAVLDYAVKHSYPSLANRAAPYVTLEGLSDKSKTNAVSPEVFRRWVPYYNKWTRLVRCATTCSFATRADHIQPDSRGRMALNPCSYWPKHQKGILAALAGVAGTKNDRSIAELITVPREAASCCFNEALSRQKDVLRAIEIMPPFSAVS